MRRLLDLLKREIRLVSTDHSLLLTLLIAPILYAFFYGSIYSQKEEKGVKIAVVDADGSSLSRNIVEQIDATPIVHVIRAANIGEAKQMMFTGKSEGYMYIARGLKKDVLSLQQAHIVLALNNSRFLPSSDLQKAITQISLAAGIKVRIKYFKKTGKGSQLALWEARPVKLNHKSLYNPSGSYGSFILPGLLALILQQTLLIGLTESMALERQRKSLTELIRKGRGNLSAVLWGKGLGYFVLFACYALFFVAVNFNILHIPFRGSPLDLSILMAVFLLSIIPLGLLIGSFFKSQVLSLQVMAFSTYPIFLITGYSVPYHSLPQVVQGIASLLPTTPFLLAYQSMVLAGSSLLENKFHLLHLILLWLLFVGLFLWRLRHLEKQKERV
jgi:ABC-2 type transport system permease protein